MGKPVQFICPHCKRKIVPDEALTRELENLLWPSYSKFVTQESNTVIKQKEKIINDLKKQLGNALRKAEMVPNELKGSVQEAEIAGILTEAYPHDIVERIGKGKNGADILQVVRSEDGTEIGKLYYESKNCQAWSNGWIPKLKRDNRAKKANAMVIVTQSLPQEVKRFCFIDGVWICEMGEIKEFSFVLRYILMKLGDAVNLEVDKENKMAQLFKYISSEDFTTVFHTIFDSFKHMQDLHTSEKLKLQSIWKEREILLEQILASSLEIHGYLRAIVGPAIIPELKGLNMPTQN